MELLELVPKRKIHRARSIVNGVVEYNVNGDSKIEPFSSEDILDQVLVAKNGWPKGIVGGKVFALNVEGEPTVLKDVGDLFGWISRENVHVTWYKSPGCVTKGEFFSMLKLGLPEMFFGISNTPHFPKMPKIYYSKGDVQPEKTGALDELIGFFSPATPEDAVLLQAAVMTVFWGGEPGTRPMLAFDGDEADRVNKGRGSGKTTFVRLLAKITGGGMIDMGVGENSEAMRKAIVNSDPSCRVVSFDNVKSHSFSSDSLEHLITAETISGHEMYRGTSNFPNLYTYCLTMNGTSLSKDLALRAVQIRMARPKAYEPEWGSRLAAWLKHNRGRLERDVGWRIEIASKAPNLKSGTRFPEWDRSVLAGACEANGDLYSRVLEVVVSRQVGVDSEIVRDEMFAEFLDEKLNSLAWGAQFGEPATTEKSAFGISSRFMIEVMGEFFGNRFQAQNYVQRLKQMNLTRLAAERHKSDGVRFWLWAPEGKSPFHVDRAVNAETGKMMLIKK